MEQILLKESSTGIPYLDFPGTGGHISFVNWSKNTKGYTQLNFSFRRQQVSFLTDVNMKTFGNTDMKVVKESSVGKAIKPLINIFAQLTDGTTFPYENIEKLGKMINDVTYENVEVISPLKKRKTRVTKEKAEPKLKRKKDVTKKKRKSKKRVKK